MIPFLISSKVYTSRTAHDRILNLSEVRDVMKTNDAKAKTFDIEIYVNAFKESASEISFPAEADRDRCFDDIYKAMCDAGNKYYPA